MGIFSFVKGIGDKLTGQDQLETTGATAVKPVAIPPMVKPAAQPATTAPTAQQIANLLLTRVQSLGLAVESLSVHYDSTTDTAEVQGQVATQADREKIILALGNVNHVATVVDRIEVAVPTPESRLYTVKAGDNLSSIAKAMYGDASAYNTIFDANKPLLTDPNKIYIGQVLRIPAA
jgi:nucleoid-associated protein YgaU